MNHVYIRLAVPVLMLSFLVLAACGPTATPVPLTQAPPMPPSVRLSRRRVFDAELGKAQGRLLQYDAVSDAARQANRGF